MQVRKYINHVVSFLILGAFTIYNSKIKFLKGVCHVKKTLQYCWPHTLHKVIRSASHVEFICASVTIRFSYNYSTLMFISVQGQHLWENFNPMASNQPNLHWLWLIQREKACSINYEIIIMIIIWFKLQSNCYYLDLEYQNFSITWTCFSSPIFFPSNKADWRYSIGAASKNDRNKDTILL